jgi:membrane-bound metal-dependent hydrolase YbcI (DUF457 family)
LSLTAFIISQVAVDLESGYHLLRGDWPVHREIHSLLIAALVGVFCGSAVCLAGRRVLPANHASLQAEVAAAPAHVGGLIGGLSHSILDAVMHSDLQPFWPVSSRNPFLAVISVSNLHLLCVLSGVLGALGLCARSASTAKAG